MNLCILDNDELDPAVAPQYISYGAMFERLLRQAGAQGRFDIFNTVRGEYPASFEPYDAVLLTGSKADSFSQEPWVLRLKSVTESLLGARKKLIGVCFGHQLIALCLGAPVGRAPQGWGVGRMSYQWLSRPWMDAVAPGKAEVALLASHQDQVASLPPGATLLARSDFCPVAAYSVGDHVFCVQPHPEFVPEYSAFLLNKRRAVYGEERVQRCLSELSLGHDGVLLARMMLNFIARPQQP
ncbi:MAG: amidotransferase [Rhodoferax sp.]